MQCKIGRIAFGVGHPSSFRAQSAFLPIGDLLFKVDVLDGTYTSERTDALWRWTGFMSNDNRAKAQPAIVITRCQRVHFGMGSRLGKTPLRGARAAMEIAGIHRSGEEVS